MSFSCVPVLLFFLLLGCSFTVESIEIMDTYCKPDQSCWPSEENIKEFEASLSPTDVKSCFGLPTFASVTQQGTPFPNPWSKTPPTLTPYELYIYRNQINVEWNAYFVVMARNESDVIKAVRFAANHNLAIGVISTGHEFNDRNSGPKSIQVRTTCLRDASFDLSSSNKFGHPDGVVRLGSGMTWGTSQFGLEGVHKLAEEKNRVVVSGHAGNVGIVGWSLGGGHGQLAPLFGLGVDQIVQIELVGADGSFIVANAEGTTMTPPSEGPSNFTSNTDLFWAMRGGGGSTWGVVTALTIKLHKPRNNCSKDCYTQWTITWQGNFNTDQGSVAKTLLNRYFDWAANTSKYWSSYGSMFPLENGPYIFMISEALYVGKAEDGEDFASFNKTFGNFLPEKRTSISTKTFNTFWEKLQSQSPEGLGGRNAVLLTTVLLNNTVLRDVNCANTFVDNWVPRCFTKWTPCVLSYLFMHTLSSDSGDHSKTSVAEGFRNAHIHAASTALLSLNPQQPITTFQEKVNFIRTILAPELYNWSDASYFSESQYSMTAEEWKERFWGKENYAKLLRIKRTWDPTSVFGCRHCVGDEEQSEAVSASTMPPWRYKDQKNSSSLSIYNRTTLIPNKGDVTRGTFVVFVQRLCW